MSIVICPGLHDPALTSQFWLGIQSHGSASSLAGESELWPELWVVPAQQYPVYSPNHILRFLQSSLLQDQGFILGKELVFIGFSAGVVGAIGAARAWQKMGGVKAFIAVDGWGVPLVGSFPMHRLSHDFATHWSSGLLDQKDEDLLAHFYAEPPVSHLDLWRSPQTAQGWSQGRPFDKSSRTDHRVAMTAAQFLTHLLQQYGEIPALPSQQNSPTTDKLRDDIKR